MAVEEARRNLGLTECMSVFFQHFSIQMPDILRSEGEQHIYSVYHCMQSGEFVFLIFQSYKNTFILSLPLKFFHCSTYFHFDMTIRDNTV